MKKGQERFDSRQRWNTMVKNHFPVYENINNIASCHQLLLKLLV